MKTIVLDMIVALDEMVENGELDQFEELNYDILVKILKKAGKLANEKE